ncbi:unnamed protein product [Moneuplotes crassus]|uniref:FAD synthase n=1 Tax=Euplotes crassus TaxID=5936 RepID=A0AAD1XT57_EUPCR|nr:unnamed protein product [Moneuplotes crassus]
MDPESSEVQEDFILTTYTPPTTLSESLKGKLISSLKLLAECFEKLESPDQLVLGFNGGKDSIVMFHLVRAIFNYVLQRDDPVISYLQSCGEGDLLHSFNVEISSCRYIFFQFLEEEEFPEVISYCDIFEKEFDISIEKFTGKMKDDLTSLVDNDRVTTVIVGNRRTDPYSEHLKPVDPSSEGWPDFMRIHPLLDWSYVEIWEFLNYFKFEVCCLYEQGYTSLGRMHKTQKNPYLRRSSEELRDSQAEYYPAWHLTDDLKERESRIK